MRKKAELVEIKPPRSDLERAKVSWDSSSMLPAEQWLMQLLRHGKVDAIERFLAEDVETGVEPVSEPSVGFVYWRAPRGLFDHDLSVSFQWWAWNNSLIRF